MRVLRSVLAAALVAALVSPVWAAAEGRRGVSAVSWTSFLAELSSRASAPKRGKVTRGSTPAASQSGKGQAAPDGTPRGVLKNTPKATSKNATTNSSANSTAKPQPGKITCQVERICQDMKRPVREVVTACTMVKPSPESPPRRLCTEKVASSERAGPQLCRSAKICKVRQDVNLSR